MKFLSSPRFCLVAALLLLPLMISNDSLWLDEGDTAMYALDPNFSAWCQRLLHDGQADCQMPLTMLTAWGGGKLWGTQEWQLRALNLLWGALALAAMNRAGQRLQLPWLPLLLAIQPYFWFYQNEARPYAAQLAGGTWLLAALVEFISSHAAGNRWAWQLTLATLFLFSATMLAPLPVAMVVLVGGTLAWRQHWRVERKSLRILLGGLLACAPLAIYYVGTLLRGVKGAQMWAVDLKFVLYVFYEITGMGGIGLSSTEIRSLARSPQLAHEVAARAPQLILPLLLGVLLVGVIWIGLRHQWRAGNRAQLMGILGVPGLTAVVFVLGSLALQKAFWARHYAPVFPFYVALLGLAFAGIGADSRRWLRPLPLLISGLLIFSALNFRLAPALRKEDYRAASAFAKTALANQQTVWWLAGGYSANYYGLEIAYRQPEPKKAFFTPSASMDVRQLPKPAVIVLNKPDIHDAGGVIQKIIADNHYAPAARYEGFVIWTNMIKPEAEDRHPH